MWKQLILAILAGVLSVSIAIVTVMLFHSMFVVSEVDTSSFAEHLGTMAIFGFIAGEITLLGVLFYGLPVFLLLRRFNQANIVTCTVTALFPWPIFALLDTTQGASSVYVQFAAYSLVSALSFWYFARRVVRR